MWKKLTVIFQIKGAKKLQRKIIFVSITKIGENVTNSLNFSLVKSYTF